MWWHGNIEGIEKDMWRQEDSDHIGGYGEVSVKGSEKT
jgi:hypothetical protein